MYLEGFEVTEGIPTYLTLVRLSSKLKAFWLISSVRSDVPDEGRVQHVVLSTHNTFVRLHSSRLPSQAEI